NGQPFGPVNDNNKLTATADFRADTFAVCSFSDVGQSPPEFAGSLLAHGVVDNFVITLPPPPVGDLVGYFSNAVWNVQFTSRSNWYYTLEGAPDLRSWTNVSATTPGTNGTLILVDTNSSTGTLFYRVRANRP